MWSRTPPGVRELKLGRGLLLDGGLRRTPPGVRELKRRQLHEQRMKNLVAPLPGCVN